MSFLPTPRLLAATAALLGVAACASEAPLAPAPGAQLARGSSGGSPTVISVAGTWSGTDDSRTSAVDSTRYSLTLRQNGDRLEGGLTAVSYTASGSVVGVRTVKQGSVSGQTVSLFFKSGEGAETEPSYGGIVSDDGQTMSGFASFRPTFPTLTRQ